MLTDKIKGTYAVLGIEDPRALRDSTAKLLAALPDDLGKVGGLGVAGVVILCSKWSASQQTMILVWASYTH